MRLTQAEQSTPPLRKNTPMRENRCLPVNSTLAMTRIVKEWPLPPDVLRLILLTEENAEIAERRALRTLRLIPNDERR